MNVGKFKPSDIFNVILNVEGDIIPGLILTIFGLENVATELVPTIDIVQVSPSGSVTVGNM
jgi:hypothetical protein